MGSKALILASVSLCLLADGARISVRSQVDSSPGSVTQIGPEGEVWEKRTKYVCMQKWQNGGWGSSEGKFVEKFCLVKSSEAASAAKVQLATDISSCDSSNGKMNVCPIKGDEGDRRLSYSSKTSVPKACFRVSDVIAPYGVIEAALDEKECEEAMKLPAEQQMILPKLTTATTTTTTTTTTTEERVEEIVDDSFVEPEAEIIFEAKALFADATEDFTWNYKDMAFKCCTSTAGKPTKLQDMNAAELPSERSFGSQTGCGRMFGDTYHNGLKSYKGADPSCLVPASLLEEITGEDYESITSSLEGSD